MQIIDVINGFWSITPEMLREIQSIYATHLKGEKIDVKGIEARIGQPLNNTKEPLNIVDGVAVVSIHGIIAKRMNLLTQISGGVSTELTRKDIQAALDDPTAHSIILDIDSPGGTVDGTQELADFIHTARSEKPIVAFTNGMMTSAAYWIGSAADSITISSDTVTIGSIGVVTSHVDISKQEEQYGIKTTEITAGKLKRAASQYAPLSEVGRAVIQEQLDHIYTVFINSIARNRGVSVEKVLTMADGKLFIGRQALQAGLVDGVSTFAELIQQLNDKQTTGGASVSVNNDDIKLENENMTKSELKEKHPEVYESIIAEGAETNSSTELDVDKIVADAKADGATAERKRLEGIDAVALPGHEDLIKNLKADGTVSAGDAALRIVAAEKAKIVAKRDAFVDDSPEVQPAAEPEDKPTPDTSKMSVEDKAKVEWDKDGKLRDEMGSFDVYLAYVKNPIKE